VRHLDLDINVNFDKDIIIGKAVWTIDNLLKGNEIIFDINVLDIQNITLGNEEIKTTFSFGDEMKFHGRSLNVAIKPTTNKVTIYYSTPKNAVALQWLMPEQIFTKAKKIYHPATVQFIEKLLYPEK
jgi:leukotriene-A4 hydrolase